MFSSALLLLCFEPSRAEYVLILLERTDADPFSPHSDVKASCRRRAYSANQISDRQPLYKEPTASDPGSALLRNPLRKTQLQDLQQLSPELQPVHFQVGYPQGCYLCHRMSPRHWEHLGCGGEGAWVMPALVGVLQHATSMWQTQMGC